MSVVIETTSGDITVDLFLNHRPRASYNFLKLCKKKYYNYNLFHTVSRGFMAQTGDPTGSRSGGESLFGLLEGPSKRFFEGENEPRIKHTKMGLISFVGNEERMIGSQFFITLGEDLTYLDEKHCVFGEVVEGFDVLEVINEAICDSDDRPYKDIRITHTVILNDPYPDPKALQAPSRSPSPSAERLQGGRIAPDECVDETEGKDVREIAEMQAELEAKARATILEIVGDLPDAEMAPPENVLFVCKLNPVTTDEDLEIIFNRFGKIKSCEVIRDRKTNDSLQYAFIEFEDEKACEDAYFKMDNILIDDRRIHVDFSQSVSKVKWHGKGRGVTHFDDKGRKTRDNNKGIGKGDYKVSSNGRSEISRKGDAISTKDHVNYFDRNKRRKSYSLSPSRTNYMSERLEDVRVSKNTKKDNMTEKYSQHKSSRRVSRSRSRSPRKQHHNSPSPTRRNGRDMSPKRREMSKSYGRDRSHRSRNEDYGRKRDRSRSPRHSRPSSTYIKETRKKEKSSQSSHNHRYSKAEYTCKSPNLKNRDEKSKSEKHQSSNDKDRYKSKSEESSRRKEHDPSEESEPEDRNKKISKKDEKASLARKKANKSEIKYSKQSNSRNNKKQKEKYNLKKNPSKIEDNNRKRKRKPKESSDSSSSSDSSTDSSSSESSSDSSSSDSSDSSSESDSSDSETERRKNKKNRKRTSSDSSDSDYSRKKSKKTKKK
ncbi:uncharacterized protein [Leptinotarsa decemlineata]|uniref:uncharacterized protein n=1 Tax=Leptinotarsa decemlineata TaxID=7539 RepID=UPI003D30CF08